MGPPTLSKSSFMRGCSLSLTKKTHLLRALGRYLLKNSKIGVICYYLRFCCSRPLKKSIKNVAVAVAAAAAVFWGFYKKCLLSSFPYGIHCSKSYVHYCKHALVCDPCNLEMNLLLWRQLLANSQWSVHVCLCVPLWFVFFLSSLPLLAWLSCCLVGLLAGCLLGWLARLVGSLAGLLVGWLPGCLVGWLLGWQVACFNCCFALHFSQ